MYFRIKSTSKSILNMYQHVYLMLTWDFSDDQSEKK